MDKGDWFLYIHYHDDKPSDFIVDDYDKLRLYFEKKKKDKNVKQMDLCQVKSL